MTEVNIFSFSSIYECFQSQAKNNPSHPALIFGNEEISYNALLQKVDNLADNLAFYYGLSKSDCVAIALPVSVDFIVTILACLKCGIPYIPLNIDYPDEYILEILSDAQVDGVLTSELNKNRSCFRNFQMIDIEEKKVEVIKPTAIIEIGLDDDAYIIYTSGSTGSPKGVVIPQKNILNLMLATQSIYHIKSDDIIPLFHSLAFDFSVWEIYATLLNGASLIIPKAEDKRSIEDYLFFLKKNNVTVVNLTPAVFYYLIAAIKKTNDPLTLRLLILGGEMFQGEKAKEWFDLAISTHAKVYNMYGITEGTIHVTSVEFTPEIASVHDSVIGDALTGTKVGILNSENQLSFDHQQGELCVGGLAVAKGYLNHAKLTEEKFFVLKNERWFKTGDLVKKTEKGLIYLGRMDQQIKIRGFRIDCTEIEGFLLHQLGIKNAVVLSYKMSDGDERLAAFLQANKENVDINRIKSNMQSTLPSFMIPSKFILIDAFPLTINGKIDIAMLRKKISNSASVDNHTHASIEEKIIQAWKKVLDIDYVSETDSFFDAGGDSLLLIKLQYWLQKLLEKDIQLIDLIRYPTIESFVNFIRASSP